MVRTPRRLDAHGPEFLGNRGSRTLQNSDGSESGDNSVEDQLDLNDARASGRRASKSILAAASDTLNDLWDSMKEIVTDDLAALYQEREPLAARVRALQAEADAMKITGYATTSKREALALRQKNHVEQSPEFQALRSDRNQWAT